MTAAHIKELRPEELVVLARNPAPEVRAMLYSRLADLFGNARDEELSANEKALMLEVMKALSAQVEMSLRMALAHRLADRKDANPDLIRLLAHDKIEIAAPVILKSVALSEADLIAIIHECSVDHCTTVAQRPNITHPVCDALIDTEIPEVLRELAGNDTAQIPPAGLERLADISKHNASLLAALVHRKHMPKPLAMRMYGWASSALKQNILRNFDIDPHLLEAELAHSVSGKLTKRFDTPEAKQMQVLVDKLYKSGQLKSGFIIKALKDDQIDLFSLGFAKLAKIPPQRMSEILANGDLRTIALAARAVGIDRSVFPTIVQKLRGSDAMENLAQEEKSSIFQALRTPSPDEARTALEERLKAAA